MGDEHEQEVTAALTFKVPQKVGRSVQHGDQSWTGNEISGLIDCLGQEAKGGPVTLSLSLIIELNGSKGTVQLPDDLPQF